MEIDTEKFRALLETERGELEEELSKHGKNVGGDWQGSSSSFETGSADENEVADQIEELVTNSALVESLETRLSNVKLALEKIENGTYGKCEKSGEMIPLERLEANPAARTLVEHAD